MHALLLTFFGPQFGVMFVGALLSVFLFIHFCSEKDERRNDNRCQIIIRMIYFVLIIFFISFVFIETLILSEINTNQSNRKDIDFAVVLGAGLKGDELSRTLKGRLATSYDYLRTNQVPVIVSGGKGEGEKITEAEAMGDYLIKQGLSKSRIYYERSSTSTEENLRFSKSVMKMLGTDEPHILIITSDYHMYWAKYIAKKLNIKGYGLVSKSPLFIELNYLIREYFAVIKTYFIHIIR